MSLPAPPLPPPLIDSVLLYVHRKHEAYWGRGARDSHLDFHTAPELCPFLPQPPFPLYSVPQFITDSTAQRNGGVFIVKVQHLKKERKKVQLSVFFMARTLVFIGFKCSVHITEPASPYIAIVA